MTATDTDPTDGPPVSIVGAGLTGSMMALYLAERGYRVRLFERRDDLRTADVDAGRSINMALSTRGLRALRDVGLADRVRRDTIPMYGRKIHGSDGTLRFQSYGTSEQHINSISRTNLTRLVVSAAADCEGVEIRFRRKCVDVDLQAPAPVVEHLDTDERTAPDSRVVIGADGAYSAVRQQLLRTSGFDYSQEYLSHGYKELTIPPAADGGWRFDRNALHIWPRHDFMFIALPNPDGSFTGTLFLPIDGRTSFDALDSPADVREFFEREFPDVLPEAPDLPDEFFDNPTGSLVTIRCNPFHYEDTVLLAGDAAHAIVPFFGQGMNASFEDCTIFDELLAKFDDDWARALPAFSRRRKPDADAIAELSLDNYEEMRSRVADPSFLLGKELEQRLQEWFPDRWRSLYSLVTFSTVPYAAAKERADGRSEMLDAVIPGSTVDAALELRDALLPDVGE
ncbi:MAG: FAD-dependent oxidoreductase [Bradymonadaceae bacterium]